MSLISKIKNLFLFFVLLVFLFFLAILAWINLTVYSNCQNAKEKYDGNCREALSELLSDESNSFKDRNDAIWSLGQIGDSNALEVLEKHYTGKIPDREPYGEVLSQYEIKKAINLVKGGLNIANFGFFK